MPFDRLNDFLNHLNLGECTIKGSLEAYSCKNKYRIASKSVWFCFKMDLVLFFFFLGKHTGTDKKLSLSLENEVNQAPKIYCDYFNPFQNVY